MNRDPKAIIKSARRVSMHGTSDDPRGEEAKDTYIPYETSTHPQERMQIIRYGDTMHYPSYRYLMDIIHTESYDGIVLVYSFMIIKIRGENLQDLIEHIAFSEVTYIQKFDSRKWPRPPKGQTIIEDMDVVVRNDNDELTLPKNNKSSPTSGRNDYR